MFVSLKEQSVHNAHGIRSEAALLWGLLVYVCSYISSLGVIYTDVSCPLSIF